ncbi:glycoside hydrolase family 6 protein [Dactylosporangium vinaceum]|uniref:Glucanase n=1 Tax=Dactylosporangium vinaceum TaxID=53362 RepID=A0ABV5MDI1_9ACTN|nr:glycoside hydrolase family 6 protein [Dactylosporangium vinaceum]UAC01142.1 glycoside hydrolase family 6 protein [Dactylosporangium vinaceum]
MPTRRSRRRLIAAAVAASACVAFAAGWSVIGSASAGTLSGTLYRDPDSQVARWVNANQGDSRMPVIRDKIASQSQARWMANFNISTIQSEVSSIVGAANAVNQVPVLTSYAIPNRDCGGASAGGAPDLNQYQQWISGYARGLGNRTVIVIMETDALALQTCLSSSEVQQRAQAISTAVQTLKSANPNAKVYLDGGHSAWNSASEQGSRLVAAGVQYADGFFTNVSNFQPTGNEANYGRSIISYLQSRGINGKHQIIDTSRNGGAAGDWCADDNTDRRLGNYPTLNTGDANIDGYLWIKDPGEADGCNFAAGSFQPSLAYSLASSAPYPPAGSPTPTSASPSPSRTSSSPSPSPSASGSPSASTSPSRTGGGGGGGCSAVYQTTSAWQGGFQGNVTVTAGASAISNWTVTWTLAGGQSITQLWNGTLTTSGSAVTVRNVSYNGSLNAGGSTQFGFTGSGNASTPALTCTTS